MFLTKATLGQVRYNLVHTAESQTVSNHKLSLLVWEAASQFAQRDSGPPSWAGLLQVPPTSNMQQLGLSYAGGLPLWGLCSMEILRGSDQWLLPTVLAPKCSCFWVFFFTISKRVCQNVKCWFSS